jgi:hypothetical protein
LRLEPLPRKPLVVHWRDRDGDGIAEGVVFGLPSNRLRGAVGHNHGAVEMIGVDVEQVRAFEYCERGIAQPDRPFAWLRAFIIRIDSQDQFVRSRGPFFTLLHPARRRVFGDDVAETIPDVMRGGDGRSGGFHAQFLEAVISPCGPQRRADGQGANAASLVDRVIKRRRPARILGYVSGGIIQERTRGGRALFDIGQAVGIGRIGVGVSNAIGGFGEAIAVRAARVRANLIVAKSPNLHALAI